MTEALLFDWLSLFFRWFHVIAAIAWIGSSFYFIWLDNSLEEPSAEKRAQGIKGDLWSIHGGGIYEIGKYKLRPAQMPEKLHWFKWEAYTTWLTGTALILVIYYFQATHYLVDANAWINSAPAAIVASLIFIVGGVIIYELLLRTARARNTYAFLLAMLSFLLLMCYLAVHLFSARAAFIHVGVMLGSIMVGNVFFGIIPSQKALVRAVAAGEEPDAQLAESAKLRSTYNNYFTLPVVFCMISNHYAFLYSHAWNWLVLYTICCLGAYVRHFFNLRHRGIVQPSILIIAAVIAVAGSALLSMTNNASATQKASVVNKESGSAVSDLDALQIVQHHCHGCHAQHPTGMGFTAAPQGLVFENIAQLQTAAPLIDKAVTSQYMPLGNTTNMSTAERTQLLVWLRQKNR